MSVAKRVATLSILQERNLESTQNDRTCCDLLRYVSGAYGCDARLFTLFMVLETRLFAGKIQTLSKVLCIDSSCHSTRDACGILFSLFFGCLCGSQLCDFWKLRSVYSRKRHFMETRGNVRTHESVPSHEFKSKCHDTYCVSTTRS